MAPWGSCEFGEHGVVFVAELVPSGGVDQQQAQRPIGPPSHTFACARSRASVWVQVRRVERHANRALTVRALARTAGANPRLAVVRGCHRSCRSCASRSASLANLAQELAFERARRAGHSTGGGHCAAMRARPSAVPKSQSALAASNQKTRQRHQAFGHAMGKGLGAVGADEAVGVVLGRQKQKLHAARVVGQGQNGVQRLAGGASACGVAIKAEDDGLGEAKQLVARDRVCKPCPRWPLHCQNPVAPRPPRPCSLRSPSA